MGLCWLTKYFLRNVTAGRICRYNTIAGLHLCMYEFDSLKATLEAIDRECERRVRNFSGPHPPAVCNLIPLFVEALKHVGDPAVPRPMPRYAQDAFDSEGQRLATVVPIDAIKFHLLDPGAISVINAGANVVLGAGPTGGLTRREWRRLRDNGPWEFNLRPGATLGFRLLWFTTEQEVEQVRAAGPSDAFPDRLRDALGLVHHETNVGLWLVTFPGENLSGRAHYRPIALDAGGNRRFKLRHSDDSIGHAATRGKTVDLHALESASTFDIPVDGLSEWVVSALTNDSPFNAKLRFEAIGITEETRGIHPSTDIDFEARLEYGNRLPGSP